MQARLHVLSGALVLAALVLATEPAGAHAVVQDTVPADGALLESAPDEVVIRFNEPVALIDAQVLDGAGSDIVPGDAASVRGNTLRIELPDVLAEGTYVASYRVMSIDSHPVGGSIVFSAGRVSTQAAAPQSAANDRAWRAATVAIRAILYCGILGGGGAVLFLLLVGPPAEAARTTARIGSALAAAGIVAALLAVGIQGGRLSGGPLGSLSSAATWKLGLTSAYGASAIAAVLGLALVVAGLRRQQPVLRAVACFGAAFALASFALSGHVLTAGPRWLTVPILIMHTAAVSFWIGALAPLHQVVRSLGRQAAPIVRRFSRIAVGAVVVLVGSGLVIGILQVASVRGLIDTTYGRIFLVKLVLVAGLLVLAAANKLRLTPALVRGEAGAARALRGTIVAEMGLVLAIFVATASLGTTPPPRTQADGAPGERAVPAQVPGTGLSVTIVSAARSADIALASARSGVNRAELRLRNAAGAPLQAQEVTLTAANPGAGVEPISRQAEALGPGAWRVEDLLLVPGGTWLIRIEVLVNDFEKVALETALELRQGHPGR